MDVPACIVAASDQYFNDEDVLGQFIADEIVEALGGFVTTTDLHEQFSQWMTTQGLNVWTLRTLQKELCARQFETSRRRNGAGFAGILLK